MTNIAAQPDPLRWRSWPLRDEPGASLLLLLAAGAVTYGCGYFGGPLFAVAAAAVQAAALWRWLLPAVYEVNTQGVHARILGRERRIAWKAIELALTGRRGVYLVPRGTSEWLWRLWGWHVPWGQHRTAVQTALDYYLAKPATQP